MMEHKPHVCSIEIVRLVESMNPQEQWPRQAPDFNDR